MLWSRPEGGGIAVIGHYPYRRWLAGLTLSGMGYQFVTLQAFSRKPDEAGRSVAWVLDEAERRPGACVHVAQPAPPETVHGVDLGEVRRLHDDACESARVALANGRTRAIRRDQKTLLTVVASHPATMDQARADPQVAADVEAWEKRTVAWLKDMYGPGLLSVIRHSDESHPHLHVYVLPQNLRANDLHPGSAAKRAVVAAGPSEGEDAKSLNKRGDQAYRQALRAWQDSYHEHVGVPCGLARLGPQRRRLTRVEWHAEQTAAKATKAALDRAADIDRKGREFVARVKSSTASVIAAAKEQATEAKALHTAAEAKERKASAIVDDAVQQVAAAKAIQVAAEAREQKASIILDQAGRQAERIVAGAEARASRISSFGSKLRSLWDGLRKSSLAAAARLEAAREIARERARADDAHRRLLEETSRRHEADRRARGALEAVRSTAAERDVARQELAALRPAAPALDAGRRLGR